MNPSIGGDVKARAEQLLDERDREHKDRYDHYPGQHPQCTQPSRERYRAAAEAAVTDPGHSIIPDGCPTAEANRLIKQAAPWWYVPDPHGDPAMEQARRELAAKISALQVTP